METLGVYVQVPFCASKCTFCNFSSRVAPASALDAYARAVEREIELLLEFYARGRIGEELSDLPIDTIYVGGGTPSLAGCDPLEGILAALYTRFQVEASLEFTLEVTPGSADKPFLVDALALGFNRLSIGAQSFDDRELRSVGRLHSAEETHNQVSRARRAGFRNINLDLIAGLPYQTEASWLQSLRAALALKPEHLSVYLFEIDEISRLGREVLRQGSRYNAAEVPGDDLMADAYETARELLAGEGYTHYEISNFALPGRESLHNQKYWQLKSYVGLGAGAHSFDGRHRWANETTPEVYAKKLACGHSPIAEIRSLSPQEQLEEFFFLGLRQREGVDLRVAGERWDRSEVSRWEPKIAALARSGWLEWRGDRISLLGRAYLVSNEIFQEFLA